MAYKKLSDFTLVKEYCDTDECTGHDCYCDSFTCNHWVREYIPLHVKQLIDDDKLTYDDVQCKIVKGDKVVQEFEVLNNPFINDIVITEKGDEKMKEADEKPIDHKIMEEFKGKIYNNGVPISQNKYDMLKEQGLLENDMYYLIEKKVDYKLDATNKWCSLSNAIIKKYKSMVEFDDESLARTQLKFIKKWLIDTGYFKHSDFEDWGE